MSDNVNDQALTPFTFNQTAVRTTLIDQNIWFVAKDVCDALDISWSGNDSLSAIQDDWKRVRKFRTQRGERELIVINEPALYKFAFRSNKPEADKFTNWVAGEVLPQIRRTGSYSQGSSDVPEGFRVCRECEALKPLNAFRKDARLKEGYSPCCNQCVRKRPSRLPGHTNPDPDAAQLMYEAAHTIKDLYDWLFAMKTVFDAVGRSDYPKLLGQSPAMVDKLINKSGHILGQLN